MVPLQRGFKLKRTAIAIGLAVLIGLPFGWMISMMLTPVLWKLEPILHMELGGHSGPSDWIFYVVWLVLITLLFGAFRWVLRKRPENFGFNKGD
jgi:ABC-type antimicrobial peptide transport system permease subunit